MNHVLQHVFARMHCGMRSEANRNTSGGTSVDLFVLQNNTKKYVDRDLLSKLRSHKYV